MIKLDKDVVLELESIRNDDFQKADLKDKNSEAIKRPSLTYLQDSWLRFKRNKVALVSMVLIAVILIVSVFLPEFWRYTYADQNLNFANIPPTLKIYDIGDETYVYIAPDYRVIETTKDGELISAPKKSKKGEERIGKYTIGAKTVEIDYRDYFAANAKYINAQKKQSNNMEELKSKLDTTPLFRVYCDGVEIKDSFKVHNKTYIWGSDTLGRDLFVRVIYGGRISLIIGFVAAFINFVIGVIYGGISGYFGGTVDNVMMRIVEIISSIPMLLYIILLMVIMEPGLNTIIVALSITYWVGMARIVRGEVLSMREQEFIVAAKTLGASTFRILKKHLIPNIMGPIMVSMTMQIPSAMFAEAFLGFIGLGVAAPVSSWGKLCNDALSGLFTYPYQLFYPAMAISITILSFNLLGDGLRDSLDPKQR